MKSNKSGIRIMAMSGLAMFLAFAAAVPGQGSRKGKPSEAVLEKVRGILGAGFHKDKIVQGLLDGDERLDIAALVNNDKKAPYRLVVLRGNADGSFTKILDKKTARCPDCGGAKGLYATIKVRGRTIIVNELGGSRWAWSNSYHYRYNGTTFALTRIDPATWDGGTGDSINREIHLNSGLERRTLKYGSRSEYKKLRKRKYKIVAYHLTTKKTSAAIKLDGYAGEGDWTRAPAARVNSGSFIYYGRAYRRGTKDLSFTVRSLYNERYVYFYFDIKDDRRVFGRSASVKTDHVELWFTPTKFTGDDTRFMRTKFDPAKTMQFGLVPVRRSRRVIVRRWYPKNAPGIGVEASYRKSRRGYTMEVRVDRSMIMKGDSKSVFFTAAVSDVDNRRSSRRKTLMGTSRLNRRAIGHQGSLIRDSIMNQGFLTDLSGD